MKIYETHAHYDDAAFDDDRDVLITEMLGESGVLDCLINVGASMEGCHKSLKLAERYSKVYAAIGIHPDDVGSLTQKDYDWIKETAVLNPKVVAIGEIGLDYHYMDNSKEVQLQSFRKQLNIARQINKPVIIHSREACADTLQCMREEHAEEVGGVIHCYSYTKESAIEFLKMGFYFGIGGVVTFKNAKKLVAAVKEIPIEKIILETDCPYMAPEPNRGKRNYSGYIPYVAEKIAQIKGLTAQEVIDITNHNAHLLFKN